MRVLVTGATGFVRTALCGMLNRPARLLPMPKSWLRFAASALGSPVLYERLCGSLQIDIGNARVVLDWSPPLGIDEELARTAHWLLHQDGSP
jgi:UDP-glucose 4-epimerase